MIKLKLIDYRWTSLRSLFLLLLTFVWVSAVAQDRSVSGKVTDSSGEGLPGVSVLVKGTSAGTVTDIEGNYKLSVSDDAAVLVYSFIGMRTEEVVVGSRSTIDLEMQDDITALDEVVVIGYGTKKKAITEDGIEALKAYDWSGNIRELRNVTERLVIMCGESMDGEDVKKYLV